MIQGWQRSKGASPEHAQFTHAALFVGLDHLICEAVPNRGVMYSVLDLKLEGSCWIARRWPDLTLQQRQGIVAMAASRLGEPYNYRSAAAEFVQSGRGPDWEDAGQGLVCSRLCDRSMVLALLKAGFPADQVAFSREWVTPAVLSQTHRLVDVELNWRRAKASV